MTEHDIADRVPPQRRRSPGGARGPARPRASSSSATPSSSGVGDPKGLGWVTRVVGRTEHPDLDLTAYNLGVRGDSSARRPGTAGAPSARRAGPDRTEQRLVRQRRHRTTSSPASTLGPPPAQPGQHPRRRRRLRASRRSSSAPRPPLDPDLNARLEVLVDAQADVCARRSVPFVDCYRPLAGHDQWRTDLSASERRHPPRPGRLRPDRLAGAAQRLGPLAAPACLTLRRRRPACRRLQANVATPLAAAELAI